MSPSNVPLFSNTAIPSSNNGVKGSSRHFRKRDRQSTCSFYSVPYYSSTLSTGSPTSINERLKRSVPQRSHASSTFLTETLNHQKVKRHPLFPGQNSPAQDQPRHGALRTDRAGTLQLPVGRCILSVPSHSISFFPDLIVFPSLSIQTSLRATQINTKEKSTIRIAHCSVPPYPKRDDPLRLICHRPSLSGLRSHILPILPQKGVSNLTTPPKKGNQVNKVRETLATVSIDLLVALQLSSRLCNSSPSHTHTLLIPTQVCGVS